MSATKRKREVDDGSRKTRRLSDEPESVSETAAEAWQGISEQPPENVSTPKLKLPPTGEELRAINDAKDLFKSNTFKLQIDALLPNIRPKESRIPPLDHFLNALHAVLSSLSAVAPQHPLEAANNLLKKGIAVPYGLPRPTKDTNWKVAFEKPTVITVVGSWANKISVKGKDATKFGVDLSVEMPSALFQEKDYLNGRFFHKRAYFLAHLASEILRSKSLNVDVAYDSAFNNPRLTKLVLHPRKGMVSSTASALSHVSAITPCPCIAYRLPMPTYAW
ncbi:Nrap protein-domain-containing protein [Mycena amicta]|nr:Nrap protein-domain-containing protein [Mycena amicta]